MENITIVAIKSKLSALCSSPSSSSSGPVVAPGKKSPKPPTDATIGVKFVSAGLAACIGDLITFPLDTAKVRLQIQGEGATATTGSASAASHSAAAASVKSPQYRGLVGTICTISRHEGPRALYNGLCAGLQRQMCFASVRIGLYDSVKNIYASALQSPNSSGTPVVVRLLAGSTTGALAVACAQPTDVVKVRMQAQSGSAPKRYNGVIQAYRMIGKNEGVRGLWKGLSPNIARNAIVNCCELVSYDMIKETILRYNLLSDSMPCHFSSAFGAGFITTVIASPVDVVKTRVMNSAPGTYKGVIDCAIVMAKKEGPKAFYKGFTPSFMRIAGWNVIMFVSYEQLKRALTSELPSIEISVPLQKQHV